MPNKMLLLRNHRGHLLKVNFREVRRAASLSLELRANLWFACSRVELAQPQRSAVIKILCPTLGVFCSQRSLCWCEVVEERVLHALLILEVVCFGDVFVSAIILAIKLQP